MESDADLIDKLHLLDSGRLKRAALLLFGADPERLVTGAFLKIGYFHTDSDLLYHDEIHGNLFTQIDRGLDLLLTKYLRASINYHGPQRIETWPVPARALREALINAIAHKDYTAAIPIQVSVYPDRLLIWNPGHLPQGWTLAQLTAKHASIPFNPDLAFRAAYLEAWGRGIDLIRRLCHEHGCPEPQLRWDNGLWVEFRYLPEHRLPAGLVSPEVTGEVAGAGEVTGEVERLVLELEGQMSRVRLQQALGLRHQDHFRDSYLIPALRAGLVELTIPEKPTSSKQQYQLTTRGQVLRAKLLKENGV